MKRKTIIADRRKLNKPHAMLSTRELVEAGVTRIVIPRTKRSAPSETNFQKCHLCPALIKKWGNTVYDTDGRPYHPGCLRAKLKRDASRKKNQPRIAK